MPRRKKNVNTNDAVQIKDYNTRDKYKTLKYERNPELTKMYKEWDVRLDSFNAKGINVSEYMGQVIDLNKYIDEAHSSAWENEIFNLHLPNDILRNTNIKTLKYDDIREGKHLSKGDDSSGEKILLSTEKSYLNQILNIRNMLPESEFDTDGGTMHMDWLVTREREILPTLIKESIKRKWTLATFDGYLKAIRHFLKLMLGENHELRIKYTMLYSDLDTIVQFVKGENTATGDDLIDMNELLEIVDILEKRYLALLESGNRNKAFLANMDFLCVAVMVWDYPSRSDKYETEIVPERSQATQKTTYLVNEKTRELYWIYRKDVKDIGRPFVVVPLEKQGLKGLQGRLITAINESLKEFPWDYLFIKKTGYNWKTNEGVQEKSSSKSVSDWAKNVSKIPEVVEKYPKIVKKSLGINVFRRSFVTSWIDIMSNNEKRKMIHAMLTSFSKIDTYYKRRYNTDELKSLVKLEFKEPEGYNSNKPIEVPHHDESSKNTPIEKNILVKKPMTNAERQRKYYMKHKKQEKSDDKKRDKDPERKAMRIVRELNAGKKNFGTMKPSTIQQYSITKVNGEYKYELKN